MAIHNFNHSESTFFLSNFSCFGFVRAESFQLIKNQIKIEQKVPIKITV